MFLQLVYKESIANIRGYFFKEYKSKFLSVFIIGCEKIYRNNCLKLYQNTFIQICSLYIEGKLYEKLSYCNSIFVITTIVYALLVPVFFEMDNVYGKGENFVDDNNNDKMTTLYSQQEEVEVAETECKSPCPSTEEMCIAMCV